MCSNCPLMAVLCCPLGLEKKPILARITLRKCGSSNQPGCGHGKTVLGTVPASLSGSENKRNDKKIDISIK